MEEMKKLEGQNVMEKYEIQDLFAYGGMSALFNARDIQTSEKVVFKVIDKQHAAYLQIGPCRAKKLLESELKAAATLRHPNIVRHYGYFHNDRYTMLVMEKMDGLDLQYGFTQLRNIGISALDAIQARHYFKQLMEAVRYCHDSGVFHRDIKLSNILLSADGRVLKLCDFGLCTWYNKNATFRQLSYSACGTLDYQAPEVLAHAYTTDINPGPGYCARASDVWSCGVVLYTLICGALPFRYGATPDVVRALLNNQVRWPAHLSSQCKDLLQRILDPRPHMRISVADVLSHPFLSIERVVTNIESPSPKRTNIIKPSKRSCLDYIKSACFPFRKQKKDEEEDYPYTSPRTGGYVMGRTPELPVPERAVWASFTSYASKENIDMTFTSVAKRANFYAFPGMFQLALGNRHVEIYVKVFPHTGNCNRVVVSLNKGSLEHFYRFFIKCLKPGVSHLVFKWLRENP